MNTAIENHTKGQFISIEKYELLLSDYEYLKQQLEELKRMIFGSKSERFISTDDSQLSLFTIEQEAIEKETEEKAIPGIKHRKKRKMRYVQKYRLTYHALRK